MEPAPESCLSESTMGYKTPVKEIRAITVVGKLEHEPTQHTDYKNRKHIKKIQILTTTPLFGVIV